MLQTRGTDTTSPSQADGAAMTPNLHTGLYRGRGEGGAQQGTSRKNQQAQMVCVQGQPSEINDNSPVALIAHTSCKWLRQSKKC